VPPMRNAGNTGSGEEGSGEGDEVVFTWDIIIAS